MGRSSQDRRTEADQHYAEIGEALASLVVEGGWPPRKAWGLVSGLTLYRRWMVDEWVNRYREENPAREPSRRRRKAQERRRAIIDGLAPLDDPGGPATLNQ
jgi:hypothetical protein